MFVLYALFLCTAMALFFRFVFLPFADRWSRKRLEETFQSETEVLDVLAPSTEDCVLHSLRGRRTRHACGHVDNVRFKISLWGEEYVDKRGWRAGTLCANCTFMKLRKSSIRCGRCGHAILPGALVTRHQNTPEICPNPEWKTFDGEYVLGCMRYGCVEGGYRACGHWTHKGFVPYTDDRGASLMEAMENIAL